MASEIRVDKINSLSGVGTVTLSPTGVDISGITTAATLKATTGIVTTLTATTGIVTTLTTNTLTANSTAKVGSGVTLSPDGDIFVTGVTTSTTVQVGAAVTITESGIEASGIGITCASINGNQIGGRRNLIINGAMTVAQRGTSHTGSNNYGAVDRFYVHRSVTNEPTQEQVNVASGTTPYSLGFRKAYKITNGDQTIGNGKFLRYRYGIEAQDLANSGWNYTSTSSYITISFWLKSSVAQNFYIDLQTSDGTAQNFAYETGSLTADTWTKIVKTIPGNSNLTFDNDAGSGMFININAFMGTNYTDSGHTLDTWSAFASGNRIPDMTSTWYTTNDATWEITGVQLEVGSQATAFEHRNFGEELALCQRYFWTAAHQTSSTQVPIFNSSQYNSTASYGHLHFPTEMRDYPSLVQTTGTGYYIGYGNNSSTDVTSFNLVRIGYNCAELQASTARGQGNSVFVRTNAQGAKISFEAEF